jgi:hypothetical protein
MLSNASALPDGVDEAMGILQTGAVATIEPTVYVDHGFATKIVQSDDLLCGDLLDENPGASKDLSDHAAVPRELQESVTGRNPSPAEEQQDTNHEASQLDLSESSSQAKPRNGASGASALTDGLNEVPLGESRSDAVAADKPTVYLGRGFGHCPENKAYCQFVKSKQSAYRNSNAAQRQQMVLDSMKLFNFEQDGTPLCPSRIQRKIRKALLRKLAMSPERMSKESASHPSAHTLRQENSPISLGDQALRGQEDPSLDKHLDPCGNSSQQGKPSNGSSDATAVSSDGANEPLGEFQAGARTVYIGRGFGNRPGNISFRQFALSRGSEYRRSDATQRELMVREAMRVFIFLKDEEPLSVARIREKIQSALWERVGCKDAVSPWASGIGRVGASSKPVAAPTGSPPAAQQADSLIYETFTKHEFSDNGKVVAAKQTTTTPELVPKQSSIDRPTSIEIPNPSSDAVHDFSLVGDQPTQHLSSATKDERNGDHQSTRRDMDWDDVPEPVCL